MLNRSQATGLVNKLTAWYFNNNIDKTARRSALPFHKVSQGNPSFSSDIWAELMTDAIMAFSEGLEDQVEPGNRVANKNLYKKAIDLVGPDAFTTMAFIVSAAGTQLPMNKNAATCPQCNGLGYEFGEGAGGGVYNVEQSGSEYFTPDYAKGLPKHQQEKYKEDVLFDIEEDGGPGMAAPDPTQESSFYAPCSTCGGAGFIDDAETEEPPIEMFSKEKDIEKDLDEMIGL